MKFGIAAWCKRISGRTSMSRLIQAVGVLYIVFFTINWFRLLPRKEQQQLPHSSVDLDQTGNHGTEKSLPSHQTVEPQLRDKVRRSGSLSMYAPSRPIEFDVSGPSENAQVKGAGVLSNRTRRFWIRINDGWHGFFAQFLVVMNEICYAEQHGLVPYIFIDGSTERHGPNRYFDVTSGNNIWEYYFLPISSEPPPTTLKERKKDLTFNWDQERAHHISRDAIKAYYYGHSFDGKSNKKRFRSNRYDDSFYYHHRSLAHRVLDAYLRLKPQIFNETQDFVRERFIGKTVLGVHMRGTDKIASAGGGMVIPAAKYAVYIQEFLKWAAESPNVGITNAAVFIATESQSLLDTLVATLEEKYEVFGVKKGANSIIITREVLRSPKYFTRRGQRLEQNIFLDSSTGGGYQKGKDVLIDALLLSQCDFLIHGASSVSEAAFWFNLALHNSSVHLQYEDHEDVAKQTAAKENDDNRNQGGWDSSLSSYPWNRLTSFHRV
mmetsp:Transcript_12467/g.20693  ORF Transcript_12467/g.20693 Transcript_12467/m.20693 type:complete len:492 (+) Transcript_12467:170-1645(+)